MRETMMKKYECPQTKWMTVETAGIMAASREGGVVEGTLSKENNCSWIEVHRSGKSRKSLRRKDKNNNRKQGCISPACDFFYSGRVISPASESCIFSRTTLLSE